MAKSTLLASLICSALVCNAQVHKAQKKTELAKQNLQGYVLSVKTYLYPAKGDSATPVKGDLHSIQLVTYTRQGDILESAQYDNKDSLKSRTLHKFDAKGNDILDSMVSPTGILLSKSVKKYDSKGNLLTTYFFGRNDMIYNVISLKYDDDGNNVESDDSSSGSTETVKRTFEYDAAGNQTLEVSYQKGTEFGRVQKIYNAKGQMTETIDGKGQKGYCTYDKFGNELNVYYFDKDAKKVDLHSLTYAGFDAKNNWTTATVYSGNEPVQIAVREIKYYEAPKPTKSISR